MQLDQFWEAHAAGVLHSAAGRMLFEMKLRSQTAILNIPATGLI